MSTDVHGFTKKIKKNIFPASVRPENVGSGFMRRAIFSIAEK